LDLELNIITTIAYKCCADHSIFMNYDPCGESFADCYSGRSSRSSI